MSENLFLLAAYILPILAALCVGAFFGDRVMDWQDARARLCFYGLVRAGAALKPRAKKCNFTTTMRNILAKLGFN